eukprot:s1485_g16.t1
MHAIALAEHAIKTVFDPNCQELANSVRECAKLAFVNEQLLGATMQAGRVSIPHSLPQDFANVSRELCKTSYIDVPTMSATTSVSLQRVHESNAQDLSNAVQRLANVQFRSVLLMHSAARHAGTRMGQFEGSDFSSTAWSFSTMESTCEALFEAIAEEVSKKVASLGPQQLGTLADLNLPCQGAVEEELRVIIQQFAEDVPSSMDGFRSGRYQTLVEDLAVDSFGSWGDRLLLDLLGIQECMLDFRQKATKLAEEYQEQQQSWWRSESLLRPQVRSSERAARRSSAKASKQVTSLPVALAMEALRCYMEEDGYVSAPILHKDVDVKVLELIEEELAHMRQQGDDLQPLTQPRDTTAAAPFVAGDCLDVSQELLRAAKHRRIDVRLQQMQDSVDAPGRQRPGGERKRRMEDQAIEPPRSTRLNCEANPEEVMDDCRPRDTGDKKQFQNGFLVKSDLASLRSACYATCKKKLAAARSAADDCFMTAVGWATSTQVVSVAEIDIRAGDFQVNSMSFQKNGFDGWRPSKDWLRPTVLPFNSLVDRSLCSENQLLSKLYEKLHNAALSKTSCRPFGRVQLYVTGAPCLSCVGAMRQFSMLLPLVQLNVSIGPEIRPDLSQLLELQAREKDVASYSLVCDYECVRLRFADKREPNCLVFSHTKQQRLT